MVHEVFYLRLVRDRVVPSSLAERSRGADRAGDMALWVGKEAEVGVHHPPGHGESFATRCAHYIGKIDRCNDRLLHAYLHGAADRSEPENQSERL